MQRRQNAYFVGMFSVTYTDSVAVPSDLLIRIFVVIYRLVIDFQLNYLNSILFIAIFTLDFLHSNPLQEQSISTQSNYQVNSSTHKIGHKLKCTGKCQSLYTQLLTINRKE